MRSLIGTGLLVVLATSANATVIDFESIPTGFCGFIGSSVTTQGFTFTDTGGGGLWNCGPLSSIHNGSSSALLSDGMPLSSFTMAGEFGGAFSLSAFEAGSRVTGGEIADGLIVTGTRLGLSSVTEVINFPETVVNKLDFKSFTLSGDFTNLIAVDFLAFGTQARPNFLIDNISVTSVLEPGSLSLLGAGLVAVFAGRRRRVSASTY